MLKKFRAVLREPKDCICNYDWADYVEVNASNPREAEDLIEACFGEDFIDRIAFMVELDKSEGVIRIEHVYNNQF